ncbi:hypothetical protein CEXT_748541 [Caerostris extrusa]|uniref:Uncharacterized protein n=1 Tax=Caerostris extrusa TaxID=172846 RepID=A0AAV4T8H7_CAEEX|nr:hypothetical protein CEXT_748541 [Caerostris extrusa]
MVVFGLRLHMVAVGHVDLVPKHAVYITSTLCKGIFIRTLRGGGDGPSPPTPLQTPSSSQARKVLLQRGLQGKRVLRGRESQPLQKGQVREAGQKGRRCNSDEAVDGRYSRGCPCAQGLDCVARKTVQTPWGDERKVGERCVDPSRTTVEPDTGSEAPETEEPEKEPEEEPETPADEE